MDANGSSIGRVANDRNKFTNAYFFCLSHQFREERSSKPLAMRFRRQVNGVFGRVPESGARLEPIAVSKTQYLVVIDSDQVRQFFGDYIGTAVHHVVFRRGFRLESSRAS